MSIKAEGERDVNSPRQDRSGAKSAKRELNGPSGLCKLVGLIKWSEGMSFSRLPFGPVSFTNSE